MTVDRSFIGHETRFTLRDGAKARCVLAFDAGQDGRGPAAWKILLPGPLGTEELYGTRSGLERDAARLSAWLGPIVGQDAATELAAAVDADPPHMAAWRRPANG
jgi:hypothetical protein